MHDPSTLVRDIHIPFTGKKNSSGGWEKYPTTIFSIWHIDPEKDGNEDSCGWFKRAHHGDKTILEKMEKEFNFEIEQLYKHPHAEPISITLTLFHRALYVVFKDWKKVNKYMDKHLHDIIFFANNPVDSIVRNFYTEETTKDKAHYLASVIYGYILRDLQHWWQHPRWHIHHWKINCPPIAQLKRYLFSRCAGCGEKFKYGESPTVFGWHEKGPQWFKSETGVYHGLCAAKESTKRVMEQSGRLN